MKLKDFLSKYDLSWHINELSEPDRFSITFQKDIIPVYVLQNGRKSLCVEVGRTSKEATENLIEMIKGNRLRIMGFDSNAEYIDLKIKVPNDLTIE